MDKDKFENIVNRRLDMTVRLAFAYLKSFAEAEDAAQDVFFKLYRENIDFDSPESEKAWIIRVTINCCINRLRTAWFSKRSGISTEYAEIESDGGISIAEDEDTVLSAVLSLPVKYRSVIHLFYYEEYSVKEIAELTGTNESTVRTRLQRGRERLRKILGKDCEMNECTVL